MASESDLFEQALAYHSDVRPGKLSVEVTKPTATAKDLALAYSPGVAAPVIAIAERRGDAYKYTNKGNLVGVISNGTAILGLGARGALASKPVMEGKGVLFRTFAGVDVFDIEVDTTDVDRFVETVELISKTFGGINLEDIAAPACFEIEQRLIERCDVPVFHDDQHGTAVTAAAALLNALELQGHKLEEARVVCVGAGAAGIATLKLLVSLGADPDNLSLLDSKGVVYLGRADLVPYKLEFARDTENRTLEDALDGVSYAFATKNVAS